MSEPKYKKGDKVWTVKGEGGVITRVFLDDDDFRKRWYSVRLTVPNRQLDSTFFRRGCVVTYREPDLIERPIPQASVLGDRCTSVLGDR